MATKGTYRSCDLYLSAFLKTAGVIMCGTERDPKDPKKIHFIFDDDGSGMVQRLEMDFFNGLAKVSAVDYSNQIKIFKSLCHSRHT